MKIAAMKKLFYLGVLLISMSLNAQFFEGFENGTFPPAGWLVTNTGAPNGQVWRNNIPIWPAYEGTYCAFVDRSNFGQGNTSENWLITPAITIGANKALSFYSRQTIMGDVGTLYQVRVSTTTQTDLNSYTTIATWTESSFNPPIDFNRISFSLAPYEGQTVYLAFVKVFTQPTAATSGDRWFLDNVKVDDLQLGDTNLTTVCLSQVHGNVHFSEGADCSGTSVPWGNFPLTTQNDNNILQTNTSVQGNYMANTIGQNLTITPNFINPNYFNATPSNYTFHFTQPSNSVVADFCITPNGTHPDLDIAITPLRNARPGFDCEYSVTYRNKGTTVQSGQINVYFLDGVLDFVNASLTPDNIQPNNLWWNFSNLAPFETRYFTFTLNLNSPQETPPSNAGDILYFWAQINSNQADETTADNSMTLEQTVVNSLDPNDKQVSTAQYGIIWSELRDLFYTIHFQNTGTANAQKVIITDYLNAQLNDDTMDFVASSHPVETKYNASNRKLEFVFDNINLPPMATDEAASQGYVSFKIKPLESIQEGDTVENTANIYFDFNDPIITNTTSTWFYSVLANHTFDENTLAIYPNPVEQVLHIQSISGLLVQKLKIYNQLGQIVKSFEDNLNSINVSELKSGLYFIELDTQTGKKTQKFIKL